MGLKPKERPDRWRDRTLTLIRAGRLASCEKELAGLGGRGLFDEETTDLDAERLFDLSWMAEEEKEPRLHTVEELRKQVLGQFPAEFALLSPEEHDLAFKLAVFGGELPLQDWNDLIPARSLVRRLWCRIDTEGGKKLVMSKAVCLATFLMMASEEAGPIRETVENIIDTVDNTLYLTGALAAETVMRDMAWRLQGTIAADRKNLYRRLLCAAYETMPDREGRLMLIHPGLADPRGYLQRQEQPAAGTDLNQLEELYDSLMEVEDPLYDEMLGMIQEVTRPEASAEETVEDLILLAKQGAPVQEMREVLSSRIICLPTGGMESALKGLHDGIPRWFSLNTTRVQ